MQKILIISVLCSVFLACPAAAQHFAAIGDYGYASTSEADVARLVKGWNPDFIITLGDNNYDQGAASTIDANIGQYYHEFIGSYRGGYGGGSSTNRFFPALGNHDTSTHAGQPYTDYFALPGNERYYSFVRGQVEFFVLNSEPTEPDGTSRGSAQAQWLKAGLAASSAPWKVVYFHEPPYSSGSHGSNVGMRWPFREWGASLVLAGHDHHYERLVVDRLTYCVNGLGGRSIYGVTKAIDGSLLRYNADYGAQLFDASADSLRVRFYTRPGLLIDSFTLRPGLSAEPQLLAVYPTPFQQNVTVEFSLPGDDEVEIRLLNAAGQEVALLQQGRLPAGRHEVQYARGGLAAGIYFVQLRSAHYKPVMRTVAR